MFVNATLDEVALAADRFWPHAAAAARRRGPGLLPRGRPAHGLRGDEGRARARTPPRCATLEAFHTDFHLLDAHVPGMLRRHGRDLRLGPGRARIPAPCRWCSPAGSRRRTSARRSRRCALRGGHAPAAPRPRRAQGPGAGGGLLRGRRGGGPRAAPRERPEPAQSRERDFGPYGGRFVPETLIPALDELEAAWLEARADPAFSGRADALLRDYVGPPDAALPRADGCRRRGRHGLPQARGPAAHRRAQDQQRARPGAAREADGQARG